MSQGLRITAIVAAYNEADIIGQTVADLVRQRIHVHVLDNLSTDGTVSTLQPYAASGLVHVEQFPAGDFIAGDAHRYEHARIMLRKQQLARELDSDWFIAHDADEFRESPWTHLNLREGIERVDGDGWNAIDFAVLNFWPTDDRFDPSVDIRDAFQHYEVGGPWDRTQVKCWRKAADVELVSSAGHDAQFASRRVFPIRFILRHYPIRSQAHGVRKIFEERKPRFLDEERQRGWHVQYDDVATGHRFLRDPKTLTTFDPERVRVDSLIHDMGELQVTLNRHRQRSVDLQAQIELQTTHLHRKEQQIDSQTRQIEIQARQIETQARQIESQARQIEGEGRQIESQAQQIESLAQQIESQAQQIGSQAQQIGSQATELGRLLAAVVERDATTNQLKAHVERLERDLTDIRASHSWKLTAPLRAIWRLLQKL